MAVPRILYAPAWVASTPSTLSMLASSEPLMISSVGASFFSVREYQVRTRPATLVFVLPANRLYQPGNALFDVDSDR